MREHEVGEVSEVSRGTKALGADTNGFGGGFPRQFIPWVKKMGWYPDGEVCWLCSGGITEPGFKVDIRPETRPDLVADATQTGLEANRFDAVFIDPPYSAELAAKLYGTKAYYHSINKFLEEGIRICKPGGLIVSLSYEVCKAFKDAEFLAVWGLYTVPSCSSMRCFIVLRKVLRGSGK